MRSPVGGASLVLRDDGMLETVGPTGLRIARIAGPFNRCAPPVRLVPEGERAWYRAAVVESLPGVHAFNNEFSTP